MRSCQRTRLHESQLLTLPERVKGETDGPQSGTARVDCLLTGAGNRGEADIEKGPIHAQRKGWIEAGGVGYLPTGAQQKGPEGALLLQCRWSSLVLFHRRIDLFRPSQNAAGKV